MIVRCGVARGRRILTLVRFCQYSHLQLFFVPSVSRLQVPMLSHEGNGHEKGRILTNPLHSREANGGIIDHTTSGRLFQ